MIYDPISVKCDVVWIYFRKKFSYRF